MFLNISEIMKLFLVSFLSMLLMVSFQSTFAQTASTVNLNGTSSTNTVSNNVATVVDPGLTITSDGTISGFTVQITGSYTSGDMLSYTGSLPAGITAGSFNTTSKSIQFTGITDAASWQAFLRTVTLQTASGNCNPEQRQVSFIAGSKLYNALNGHFYEKSANPTTWQQGFINANNSSYFGRQGYMVTITSTAENSLVNSILQTDTWIGASDDMNYINTAVGFTKYSQQGSWNGSSSSGSEGLWYWVTGPEKGTQFSTGDIHQLRLLVNMPTGTVENPMEIMGVKILVKCLRVDYGMI
jgi:hypothetical protein